MDADTRCETSGRRGLIGCRTPRARTCGQRRSIELMKAASPTITQPFSGGSFFLVASLPAYSHGLKSRSFALRVGEERQPSHTAILHLDVDLPPAFSIFGTPCRGVDRT